MAGRLLVPSRFFLPARCALIARAPAGGVWILPIQERGSQIMCRSAKRTLAAGFFIGWLSTVGGPGLGPGAAHGQYDPDGWIETDAWNLLFPLLNNAGCSGGGVENMLRNWVAPHDLRTGDPKAGDVWADV